MGRARALEVMLSAEDYDADIAQLYGWINRALPATEIEPFVRALAHRIARFPSPGHVAVKDRVNAIALARARTSATTPTSSEMACATHRRRRSSGGHSSGLSDP